MNLCITRILDVLLHLLRIVLVLVVALLVFFPFLRLGGAPVLLLFFFFLFLHLQFGLFVFTKSTRQWQSAFANRLHVRLVVTTNAIANGHKVKVVRVKGVVVLFGHIQQAFGQQIVELLLRNRVVAGRVLEVVLPIFNQETFQLWVCARKNMRLCE